MRNRILIVGNGAREHALAHKLSSHNNRDVMVLFGNAGIAREFECINPPTDSVDDIVRVAKKLAPDLVVIGPEKFLEKGLVNALEAEGILTFGPTKEAAHLESSKAFTKSLCERAHIPTAHAKIFNDKQAALDAVKESCDDNLVVKIDGLCAGKGVFVCRDKDEALFTINMLYGENGFARFGVDEKTIVIEEFLSGSEVSVFGIVNGSDVVLFSPMQDYKRLKDHDAGPNTGGMGSFGPLGENDDERNVFLSRIKEMIFKPAIKTMNEMGIAFYGLLYAGLMLTKTGAKLLEFNVRFGDPETQALLYGTRCDIFPLLMATARKEKIDIDYFQQELLRMDPSLCIVLASSGYPLKNSEPTAITLNKSSLKDARLYFASTLSDENNHLMAGNGRVLNIVARAPTVYAARKLGYGLLPEIDFLGMQCRFDIGTNITNLNLR